MGKMNGYIVQNKLKGRNKNVSVNSKMFIRIWQDWFTLNTVFYIYMYIYKHTKRVIVTELLNTYTILIISMYVCVCFMPIRDNVAFVKHIEYIPTRTHLLMLHSYTAMYLNQKNCVMLIRCYVDCSNMDSFYSKWQNPPRIYLSHIRVNKTSCIISILWELFCSIVIC